MLAFCAGLAACTRGQVAPSSAPEPLVAAAPVALPDGDADGFLGPSYVCPDEPGVAPNGCPLRDHDADGFLDDVDIEFRMIVEWPRDETPRADPMRGP